MTTRVVPVLPQDLSSKTAGQSIEFILPLGNVNPKQINIQCSLNTNIVDAAGFFTAGAVNEYQRIHAIRPAVPESFLSRVQVWLGPNLITDVQNWNQYVNFQRDLTNNFDNTAFQPLEATARIIARDVPPTRAGATIQAAVRNPVCSYYPSGYVQSGIQTEVAGYQNFQRLPGILEFDEYIDTAKLGRMRIRLTFDSAEVLNASPNNKRRYYDGVANYAYLLEDLTYIESNAVAGWALQQAVLTKTYQLYGFKLYAKMTSDPGLSSFTFDNMYSTATRITTPIGTVQHYIPFPNVNQITILPIATMTTNQYVKLLDRQEFFFRTTQYTSSFSLLLNNKPLIQDLSAVEIMTNDMKKFNDLYRIYMQPGLVYYMGQFIQKDVEQSEDAKEITLKYQDLNFVSQLCIYAKMPLTVSS